LQGQIKLLSKIAGDHAVFGLMTLAGQNDRTELRTLALAPLFALGMAEMTIPDRPNSSKQRYRLTIASQALHIEQRSLRNRSQTLYPWFQR